MKSLIAAAMPLLAVACAPLPELDGQSDLAAAADPASAVSVQQVGAAVAYMPRRIEEPGDWFQMNIDAGEALQ